MMKRYRPLQEMTITEIVISLTETNEVMTHHAMNTTPEFFKAASHYVGMNYDKQIQELRRRGQYSIADRYTEKAKEWKQ